MRLLIGFTLVALAVLALVSCQSSVEEVQYTVLEQDGAFELREYAPYWIAETQVEGDLEDVGNIAFNRLFGYISGNNTKQSKIAMTAPVLQEPKLEKQAEAKSASASKSKSEKIAMTAPVEQQQTETGWMVSFAMPASYTQETLPLPQDDRVVMRRVPARHMVAVRYSGDWSQASYEKHLANLKQWMAKRDWSGVGEPVWARYDAPFTPAFMRRNEILIQVNGIENQGGVEGHAAVDIEASPETAEAAGAVETNAPSHEDADQKQDASTR